MKNKKIKHTLISTAFALSACEDNHSNNYYKGQKVYPSASSNRQSVPRNTTVVKQEQHPAQQTHNQQTQEHSAPQQQQAQSTQSSQKNNQDDEEVQEIPLTNSNEQTSQTSTPEASEPNSPEPIRTETPPPIYEGETPKSVILDRYNNFGANNPTYSWSRPTPSNSSHVENAGIGHEGGDLDSPAPLRRNNNTKKEQANEINN